MKNIQISRDELAFIRSLNDFDIKMLLSEIHDRGWFQARKLIPLMQQAIDAEGRKQKAS